MKGARNSKPFIAQITHRELRKRIWNDYDQANIEHKVFKPLKEESEDVFKLRAFNEE